MHVITEKRIWGGPRINGHIQRMRWINGIG